MAFDQATRNRLQRFVNDARRLLEQEFTRQLQNDYGLDPTSGTVSPLASLRHLDDQGRETARILRDTLAHYQASDYVDAQAGLDRIVREQAFTVLNRLAALRMAEARGLLIDSVALGPQSRGFQLYKMVADTGLGETGDAYRTYLFSVFDELAQDLPSLFDRYSPQGRLFPKPTVLVSNDPQHPGVLELINDPEIDVLWAQDETIGWIYQYFNSKEERKKMRDSQAPRNSRELAVRNQFFTPRYVVEFLVDNTLGRLWFNAKGGQTSLRNRCQYLLVKPDENPEPAVRLRDPRTLKLLDPACGSMHFGLYAFDLFLEIYREAWNWEQAYGPGSLDVSTHPGAGLLPLCQAYADQGAYLRDVPRLIIEHNIYGVDIDPRAAQIASLALWLRGQRAWHDEGVKAKDRPAVGQGHVVAAIAPPAEEQLREQFSAKLDGLDAELFSKTLQLLKGVPELGVLLQLERQLPQLVRTVFGEHGTLFRDADAEQWRKAEGRLHVALTHFAQAAKSTYQGRLFAQDALQGLRLIALCREVFDVVVMNPPFGAPVMDSHEMLAISYPHSKGDLLTLFVERSIELLRPEGLVGAITSRNCLFQSSAKAWREQVLLARAGPVCVADLGFDVMDDAMVESAAYCLKKGYAGSSEWFRLVASHDKEQDLRRRANIFSVPSPDVFRRLPMTPLAYWIPSSIHDLFNRTDVFESGGRYARCGMGTLDDFRFVRTWWEVSDSGRWVPYAKGELTPFVTDIPTVVNFEDHGQELKSFVAAKVGSASRKIQSESFYFRKGLQYGRRIRNPSPAILPEGCIFSDSANALFIDGDDESDLLAYLQLLNTRTVKAILTSLAPVRKMEVGYLQALPIPRVSRSDTDLVLSAQQQVVGALRRLQVDETSRFFTTPSSGFRFNADSRCAFSFDRILGVPEEDVDHLIRFSQVSIASNPEPTEDDSNEDVPDDMPASTAPVDAVRHWCVGVAFGRFDWRLAIGERAAPSEREPFDPLPTKSPGMRPDGVAPFHAYAGVLVDDAGHPHDLARLSEDVLARVGAPVPGDLRRWLQKDFFPFHLQRYSKSRRKAPIYWPLATASGSYTLWLYYPSLSSQTLYTAINDFLDGPNGKLTKVTGDVGALRNKGRARTRDEEKRFESLESLELELIELRDQLLKIAPTYQPNHDDGVQITAAPLWPLFRHKPWQKILKETWAKLEKGDYDWAHLAMNYWPERVCERCKTDKSLAIAHGLEHLYVEPEAKPKKAGGRKKKGGSE